MKSRVQMPLPALIFEGIKEYYKTDESKNPFKLGVEHTNCNNIQS
jgi:hypothetical protein